MRSDMDALYERIVRLENQNRDLRNRNQTAAAEIDKLRNGLDKYDTTLQEKDNRIRTDQAGLHATFERFREDIRTLNGKIEETDYLLKKTVNRVDSSDKNTEARLAKLEQYLNFEKPVYTGHSGAVPPARPSEPVVVRKPPPTRTQPETEIIPRPADPVIISGTTHETSSGRTDSLYEDEEYNLAKRYLDEGDLERAREGFKGFLAKYPSSKNADNAQFWIGETYYRERWYEKAIDEYSKVEEKYPNGNKVRAALLKMGYAFAALGDKGSAKMLFKQLVAKYPDSSEAEVANKKLNQGF